jgi:hypothetical protein
MDLLKYITLLLEKHHIENIAMLLHALLGTEDSVNKTIEQMPALESMVKQSFQKVNQVMHTSQIHEKKDIMRFFKWSFKNGKMLESLRISLNQ